MNNNSFGSVDSKLIATLKAHHTERKRADLTERLKSGLPSPPHPFVISRSHCTAHALYTILMYIPAVTTHEETDPYFILCKV